MAAVVDKSIIVNTGSRILQQELYKITDYWPAISWTDVNLCECRDGYILVIFYKKYPNILISESPHLWLAGHKLNDSGGRWWWYNENLLGRLPSTRGGGWTGHKTFPISRLILVALDRTNIPIIHGLNTKEPIKINFGHYFPFQLKISKTRQF